VSDTANAVNVVDEERTDAEAMIAEKIAVLSQADDAPAEFDPYPGELTPDEVSFTSGAWMSCFTDVQGWLRLSDELPRDDEAAMHEALAQMLGLDVADAFDQVDGHARLTPAGVDRLGGRLDRAIQLQEQFIEELQKEGGSLASATQSWIESWDDEAPDEESSEPVSAKAQTWGIQEFSYKASRGRLDLSPSYQRGDVWPTSDAQLLIESILRGIPLPSVILLKRDDAEAAPYEVVDGKQRLTAILRFIGKHPLARQHVERAHHLHPEEDFPRLFDEDYPAFRRKWKNLMGEPLTDTRERELYFPFKLRQKSPAFDGKLSGLRGKYYTQIREVQISVADAVEVRDLFEQTTEYKIPLIEYNRATRRQIHEVFNLYNKQGKHLNAEEIRNAVFHEVKVARGLLVVAGDNEDVEGVAPFLKPDWDELRDVAGMFDVYGVGQARYRRTKLLSWLASMLLMDSVEDGQPKRLSTARHIDSLLERIQSDPVDAFHRDENVRAAFKLLHRGLEAHSAVAQAWAPRFQDTGTGAKWQELQLIASVLGVTIAAATLGKDVIDRLETVASDLEAKTASDGWQRPAKTQTATQWAFIAERAIDIAEVIGADLDEVENVLAAQFGQSGVPTLRAVAGARAS
jgi:hypothetical protein